MNEQPIQSPEQSLEIITRAIQGTKENIKGNAWYFIFWGSLVAALCLIHYGLYSVQYNPMPHILWPLGMSVGALSTFLRYRRNRKLESYRGYASIFIRQLWTGLGVGFLILLVMAVHYQQNPVMPLLLLSGIGTLVTGLSIRFSAMSLGGILLLLGALATLWVPSTEQLLLGAVACLLGQVIPGVLLTRAD